VAFTGSVKNGRRVKEPSRKPQVQFESKLVEDMPWCSEVMIVSEHLKELLEAEYPDQAQFLPVKVVGKDVGTEFFIANWLHLVDCIDLQKSEIMDTETNSEGEVEYDFDRIVIDPLKVPSDVFIFRLKYMNTTIVCDSAMKTLLRQHKITGPQFYTRL
jgi:hypothetical protein